VKNSPAKYLIYEMQIITMLNMRVENLFALVNIRYLQRNRS